MTAQDKLDAINKALEAGNTVYISTALKAWKITAKAMRDWEKAGKPLLKVANNSLWMASGKSYNCCDYCGISVR